MTNSVRSLGIAALACALISCAHATAGARYPNLEVRLVSVDGGTPFPQWSGPEKMRLDPDVIFSGNDFLEIAPSLAGGDDKKTPALSLHFTKEAGRRFEDATHRYSGRKFAFLVGGRIVAAPKILHPITTGQFEITGPSDPEIRRLYLLITRKR